MDEKNKMLQGSVIEETPKENSNSGKHEWSNDVRKRHRRTADKIQRHYRCPVHNCDKSYGSEGSLNQHMKLKHPDQVDIHKIEPVES